MSVIFLSNSVAHLNAYRDQGVLAIPGVEFYRQVGAVVLDPDNDNITTVDVVSLRLVSIPLKFCLLTCVKMTSPGRTVLWSSPLVPSCIAPLFAPGVKAAAAGDAIAITTQQPLLLLLI